jgi:hypothetical protein
LRTPLPLLALLHRSQHTILRPKGPKLHCMHPSSTHFHCSERQPGRLMKSRHLDHHCCADKRLDPWSSPCRPNLSSQQSCLLASPVVFLIVHLSCCIFYASSYELGPH